MARQVAYRHPLHRNNISGNKNNSSWVPALCSHTGFLSASILVVTEHLNSALGGRGYLGNFRFAGHAPLASQRSYPLKSIVWPVRDLILVTSRRGRNVMGAI